LPAECGGVRGKGFQALALEFGLEPVDLGLQVAQGLGVRGMISPGAGLIFHGLVGAQGQRA